ncbi:hypothetical protein MtrunA17_Chr8g0347521 [Medicago truncatula]|uniref:rRNA processing/ribosome biogenesis protein n=1 Tax=Medicago truncatula TaxID=3880 RepID=A0A072TMI2_MEDTR|nr:proline-, glutamic acid- and leucine-rich protein 1 [Medicago truncatula]KEH18714.1 rRNA processing/ribosome biogenesis protein [Medicago truncatula]RHN39774.1 hypothetical protein MtrunA17_Chr8g0347521 [Medicago truncatula]
MATFDSFRDMYDIALKPRLLNTLIRDNLPTVDHPFSNPSQLSNVVSLIKTHSLLSEDVTESMDPKQIKAWKSSVASWVDRVLLLISSREPDKRWAGISLLGVTCEECSSDRFQESYTVWFQKLLTSLQSPEDSHFVRVATCASISDLLARLSGFPKFKKDGSASAVKVVQPVLKMLHDDNSEAVWEAAVHVIYTLITSFPFSIQRHYDSVESAIAAKLVSGGCSHDMMKKLVHCLALLPKSKGDEESWSVMMQKILISINEHLTLTFEGVEEEFILKEFNGLLILPGKQPPPPLGGNVSNEEASSNTTKRSKQSRIYNVPILMSGCCMLLTNTYPVKVNVPVRLLLVLVERILTVNGALPAMSLPFMTARQQERICSELPALHMCSLELLTAIIKATGSQLLPHAASIVRFITKYFKACALPDLRIKVYSIAKTLLISMGVGMALCLSKEVVNNAIADLSTVEKKNGGMLNGSNTEVSTIAPLPASNRKRKHSSTNGSVQEYDAGGGLGVEVPNKCPVTPISLRVAALEALEALITVAGALKSEQWRSKVDSLLIVIAMDSFKEGSSREEINVFQKKDHAATATDLQFAALRALLASFLSVSRPPYLSQGLELFQRGKQQTGTKLAEFCAHAMLTLEVLIHPRALPLVDYVPPNNDNFGEAQFSFGHEYASRNHTTFGLPQTEPPESVNNLFADYLANGDDEMGGLWTENTKKTKVSSEMATSLPSSANIQERSEMVPEIATRADVEMRTVENETTMKSDHPGESVVQFQEPVHCTTSIPAAIDIHSDAATDKEPERIVSESAIAHNEANHVESASQSKSSAQSSDTNMLQQVEFKLDYGNSVDDDDDDPFPDIVDGDPNSDSE